MTTVPEAEWAAALLRSLFAGDTASAQDLLPDDATIDAPRAYPVEGRRGIAEVSHAWPSHYPYEVVSITTHATHRSPAGSATELLVDLRDAGRPVALPVAVVTSEVAGGLLVRIYHSERLISGERRRRRPVFAVRDDADPTPIEEVHPAVGRYLAAIASGSADAVLERLADGATLSNGVRPVADRDELRRIYGMMVSTGGVRLVRGHELDTGEAVVFEYTGLPRPITDQGLRTAPGGGVAVYRYDDRHRITGVSVFDDFDPDALLAAAADHES